ncbi:MAG: superinfection immunity protein [Sulfuricaulis sp.]
MGNMTAWSYAWGLPGGMLFVVLMFAASAAVYFLPAFIAFRRQHRNRVAILVVNMFLGLTGIGWIVALIWAFTADVEFDGGKGDTGTNRSRPRAPPKL